METIKSILKPFAGAFLAFALILPAFGQANVTVVPLAANTVSNVVSGRYNVPELVFINTSSSNNATLKFYDWATAATSVVRAAYITTSSYETNYTVITTNSAGLLSTNSFTGYVTVAVNNSAVTNEQTRLATVVVPAATTRTLPVEFITARGLTVLSDVAGLLEVTYRTIP